MQIVKTIMLWNVLGIGDCMCCEILACPNSLESSYPSQWTENTSTFEAGMFHKAFYPNLAGEPTIDLKFQLYFKTFWITHDKAKQIKGCQDKAFKPE